MTSAALSGMMPMPAATNLFDKDHVTGCFTDNNCYFGDERQVTATLDYRF